MKCEKCGYKSENNKIFDFNDRKLSLCKICRQFSPSISNKDKFEDYISEKLNWKDLESFRKFSNGKRKTTLGMERKAKEGKIMSRAPFGYKIINKKLIPDPEKKLKVEKLFMDFLNKDMNLTELSKKYNFSVNGIKKILQNFTYIGKIKFAGQISEGKHKKIISEELFNKVQSKLDRVTRT